MTKIGRVVPQNTECSGKCKLQINNVFSHMNMSHVWLGVGQSTLG